MSESKPRWQRIEEELFPGKTRYMLLAEMRSVLMNNPEFPMDELDKVFRRCGDYEHELIERGILAAIAACETSTKKVVLLFSAACSFRPTRLDEWVPSGSYIEGVVGGVLSAIAKVSLEGEGGLLKPLVTITCEQDWSDEQRHHIIAAAHDLRTDGSRAVRQRIAKFFPRDQGVKEVLDHFRGAVATNGLSPVGLVIAGALFDEYMAHAPLEKKFELLRVE